MYDMGHDVNEMGGANPDMGGMGGAGGMGGMGFEDIFGQFGDFIFNEGGGFGRQQRTSRRGQDIEVSLDINFMEAVTGASKNIRYTARTVCNTCHGTGAAPNSPGPTKCHSCRGTGVERETRGFFSIESPCRKCKGTGEIIANPCTTCRGEGIVMSEKNITVKIPEGIDTGMVVRVPKEGHAGEKGASAGALLVHINVQRDPYFKREGLDVHVDVPVNVAQAIAGGNVSVRTLDGSVKLKVAPGTQPEEKRVLRGKGIKEVKKSGAGDFYVHFKVNVPKAEELTPKQREALEQFTKELEQKE